LIPARNEEENIEECLASVGASKGLAHWQVFILDDRSEDGTADILKRYRANFELIKLLGDELPSGWLGKPWACRQLSEHASGKYLVFLDADVRLSPSAISSSIALMERLEWDFISPHPRQIALGFLERLIQPLLQWSWLASVPLRIAERFGIPSMTIANGQFFIVHRDAYAAIGGHEAIKSEVLDDLTLARTLIRAGFTGGVAEGSSVAQTRMYTSSNALVDGYTKSLWKAFGNPFGTFLATALLLSTQILPLLLGIAGYSLGWIAFFVMSLSHALAAIRTRSSTANIFLYPISTFILLVLLGESIRRHIRGKNIWRGRYIS
jgi:glycosyltransferase involved in cell wall biosynthesis